MAPENIALPAGVDVDEPEANAEDVQTSEGEPSEEQREQLRGAVELALSAPHLVVPLQTSRIAVLKTADSEERMLELGPYLVTFQLGPLPPEASRFVAQELVGGVHIASGGELKLLGDKKPGDGGMKIPRGRR